MKDVIKEQALKEFFSHFYDVCSSTNAFNYTMDEFYDDISEETHQLLHSYVDLVERR